MRQLMGGLAFAALLPGVAATQHNMDAKHEFGVDAVFLVRKPEGAPSRWVSGAPSDVRIGFLTRKPIMWETGVSYAASGGNSNSDYFFAIGVAAQWARDHRKGFFVNAGPAIQFTGSTGNPSGTLFSAFGDVGTRIPYGTGAIRLSTGATYGAKNATLGIANSFNVHARAGLSLWH